MDKKEKIKEETTHDPVLYHRLSVPFESGEAANKALHEFYAEVRALREKHKIPDVLIVTSGKVNQDGEVADFMNISSMGSSQMTLPMAAYAYGVQKEVFDNFIRKLATAKG